VAARTRELGDRNRDISAMLNSLEQGVFTIDERLALEPRYSAHLERLLGQSELAGRDCIDLLFASAGLDLQTLDAMRAALEFSFGSALVFAEANRPHWVREFSRSVSPGTPPRSFEVDWTPVADGNGDICRILVAVRDVTLVKELRAAAAAHARELEIVGQVLDASIEDFARLRASASIALARARDLLEREVPSASATSELFRLLHTLKGNARQLGLRFLAKAVHHAEDAFDLRSAALEPEQRRREMLAGVSAVMQSLEEYERVCRAKLGDVFKETADETEDVRAAIARQVELVRSGTSEPRAAIAAIELLLERASAVSLTELVKKASRLLPALAEAGNKAAPRVELDAPDLTFGESTARVLGDALMHAFTNALDHGLERGTERAAHGKPAQGVIRVHAVRTPSGTLVTVRDDGRGLAVETLRHCEGTTSPDEVVAERVFASGVSTATAVTASSGRGVGLDAVRAGLRALGGDARIEFVGPNEDGHRPFELVLELPPDATPGPRSTPPRRSDAPPRPSRATGTRDSWLPPGAS